MNRIKWFAAIWLIFVLVFIILQIVVTGFAIEEPQQIQIL